MIGLAVGTPSPTKASAALHRIFGVGGLNYAFFDATKTDRTLQESVGPTLADDVGEAVGLWFDRKGQGNKTLAQVVSGQSEVCPNPGGPFTSTTGWAGGNANVSVVDGKLRVRSAVSGINARVAEIVLSGLTVGATYAFRALGGGLGGAGALQSPPSIHLRNNISNTTIGWGNADGSWVYFQATEVNNRIRLRWDGNASTDNTSYVDFDYALARLVPAYCARQSGVNSLKLVRQTGGLKGDGAGTYAVSDWVGNNHNQPNIIMFDCEAPNPVAPSNFVAGGVSSGFGNNFIVGVSSGSIRANIGQAEGTFNYGPAITAGARVICAIHSNGLVGKVYLSDGGSNNGLVGTTGAVNQTTSGVMPAWMLGAYSNGGTPGGFNSGHIRRVAFGKMPTFTENEFKQITNEWRSAA